MFTLDDWITSSGRYPERASSPELTDEVRQNAIFLLNKVNDLLLELGFTKGLKISSGFRPSYVNERIVQSAKRSLHMVGLAVDIEDTFGSLDEIIEKNERGDGILSEFGLWLEDPKATVGWSHLDCSRTRADRKVRIFLP